MKANKHLLSDAALILVDVQQGFDDPYWGTRNNPDAEMHMHRLLSHWRKHKRPIVHIKNDSVEPNSPLRPRQAGNKIKEIVKPAHNEPLLIKTVNSAFIGTGLEDHLHKLKVKAVVLVGITTDHCVSTTARMAANLGFKTYVVSDATATFDRESFDGGTHYSAETMHQHALASLHKEFATVLSTDDVLGAL